MRIEGQTGDLLARIEVVARCSSCGSTFAIPVTVVRDSQRVPADRCTGTNPFECEATFYAGLIEPQAIADLERARAQFERSATTHGGIAVTVDRVTIAADDVDFDARAVARWESEGGQCSPTREPAGVPRKQRA